MRKILCSFVALAVCVGIAFAEEITGNITKIEGGKLTIQKTKFNKDTKKAENVGDAMTFNVKDDVKVVKGVANKDTKKVDAGEAIAGGLKSDALAKIGEKGVRAVVVTDDAKNVTEIRVIGGKKKNQ